VLEVASFNSAALFQRLNRLVKMEKRDGRDWKDYLVSFRPIVNSGPGYDLNAILAVIQMPSQE
jgi:hypothetical protein